MKKQTRGMTLVSNEILPLLQGTWFSIMILSAIKICL
ncbi:hypothetical protein OnM2_048059 [Erysiphe neolycopersici]|uniref:Uncharacterized protein n=1 Tax=Erysiphe neolycopersici TaxID=212602 RepID=A0A420HTJ6_9PEZI|nr:hypothetical protein OnM2_048059 [Erysiphe neolycopersici]